MSHHRGPVGRHPFHPSPLTPGPHGINDPASPRSAKWFNGKPRGPHGLNVPDDTGSIVGVMQERGHLPLSSAVRSSNPLRIPSEDVEDMIAPEGARLNIGGIWGDVVRGSIWRATDGNRFVMSACSTDVVYYLKGAFYYQTAPGFIGEVTTYPFVEAGRRSAFLVTVGECEMKLLMGILAGASGVGFVIVVGTEVLEFVVEHRDDFSAWNHAFWVALDVREKLKAFAPTLYDKLFTAIFKRFVGDVWSQLGTATTPEIISFMVGVILGHSGHALTEAAEAGSVVAPIVILGIILDAMLKRLVLSVIPNAISITSKQYSDIAKDLLARLKESGISLSNDDMVKILHEVQENPEKVKSALARLRETLDQLNLKAK
jgi:hypothetical protein